MVRKKVYGKRDKVKQKNNAQYGTYNDVFVFESSIKLCKFQNGKKHDVYEQVKDSVGNFYNKEVVKVQYKNMADNYKKRSSQSDPKVRRKTMPGF